MVCWNNYWSPICGHYFWNNNQGATKFCQRLGYSSGNLINHVSGVYATDSFKIGECKRYDPWLRCTGGCNDYELGGHCKGNPHVKCSAGQTVKISISCSGNINKRHHLKGMIKYHYLDYNIYSSLIIFEQHP